MLNRLKQLFCRHQWVPLFGSPSAISDNVILPAQCKKCWKRDMKYPSEISGLACRDGEYDDVNVDSKGNMILMPERKPE